MILFPIFIGKIAVKNLVELKKRHNFLIWEDRKFADDIMERQIRTNVLPWADLVSIHPIPGLESVQAIPKEIGIILIGEMSCYQNLIDYKYTQTVSFAEIVENVVGFVGQRDYRENPRALMFVPGISLSENSGDSKGQRYSLMRDKSFADVFVVGRAILIVIIVLKQ